MHTINLPTPLTIFSVQSFLLHFNGSAFILDQHSCKLSVRNPNSCKKTQIVKLRQAMNEKRYQSRSRKKALPISSVCVKWTIEFKDPALKLGLPILHPKLKGTTHYRVWKRMLYKYFNWQTICQFGSKNNNQLVWIPDLVVGQVAFALSSMTKKKSKYILQAKSVVVHRGVWLVSQVVNYCGFSD